jgi:hypothetical protein
MPPLFEDLNAATPLTDHRTASVGPKSDPYLRHLVLIRSGVVSANQPPLSL